MIDQTPSVCFPGYIATLLIYITCHPSRPTPSPAHPSIDQYVGMSGPTAGVRLSFDCLRKEVRICEKGKKKFKCREREMEAISTPRLARYDMICYDEREGEKRKKKRSRSKAPETPRFPVRGFPRNDVSCCCSLSSVEKEKEKCRVPENLWRSLFVRF